MKGTSPTRCSLKPCIKVKVYSANRIFNYYILTNSSQKVGAFHSTQKLGTFETGPNSVEISPKSSLKIRKLLNFHLRILQPEIERQKSNGAKNSGKKFAKLGCLARTPSQSVKFRKKLFHSPLNVRNTNRKFRSSMNIVVVSQWSNETSVLHSSHLFCKSYILYYCILIVLTNGFNPPPYQYKTVGGEVLTSIFYDSLHSYSR